MNSEGIKPVREVLNYPQDSLRLWKFFPEKTILNLILSVWFFLSV